MARAKKAPLQRDRLVRGFQRLIAPSLEMDTCSEIRERVPDLAPLATSAALEDLERTAMHDLGFRVALLAVENRGERGEIARDVGVIASERMLADHEPVSCKRLGDVKPPARVFEPRQVVIEARELRIVGAEVSAS